MADQDCDTGYIQLDPSNPESNFTIASNADIRQPVAISFGARWLWLNLKTYAWRGNQCFPGYQRLADNLGVSTRQVQNLMGELEKNGYVRIERRPGRVNIYTIFPLSTPVRTPATPEESFQGLQLVADSRDERSPTPEISFPGTPEISFPTPGKDISPEEDTEKKTQEKKTNTIYAPTPTPVRANGHASAPTDTPPGPQIVYTLDRALARRIMAHLGDDANSRTVVDSYAHLIQQTQERAAALGRPFDAMGEAVACKQYHSSPKAKRAVKSWRASLGTWYRNHLDGFSKPSLNGHAKKQAGNQPASAATAPVDQDALDYLAEQEVRVAEYRRKKAAGEVVPVGPYAHYVPSHAHPPGGAAR